MSARCSALRSMMRTARARRPRCALERHDCRMRRRLILLTIRYHGRLDGDSQRLSGTRRRRDDMRFEGYRIEAQPPPSRLVRAGFHILVTTQCTPAVLIFAITSIKTGVKRARIFAILKMLGHIGIDMSCSPAHSHSRQYWPPLDKARLACLRQSLRPRSTRQYYRNTDAMSQRRQPRDDRDAAFRCRLQYALILRLGVTRAMP